MTYYEFYSDFVMTVLFWDKIVPFSFILFCILLMLVVFAEIINVWIYYDCTNKKMIRLIALSLSFAFLFVPIQTAP